MEEVKEINNNQINKIESELYIINKLFNQLKDFQSIQQHSSSVNKSVQNYNTKEEQERCTNYMNSLFNNELDVSLTNLENLKLNSDSDHFESEEELSKSEKNLQQGIKRQEKCINEAKDEITKLVEDITNQITINDFEKNGVTFNMDSLKWL